MKDCYSNQSNEKTMQQLTKLTDRELVAAYANDNNDAFDILLDRHKQKVFNYILRIRSLRHNGTMKGTGA